MLLLWSLVTYLGIWLTPRIDRGAAMLSPPLLNACYHFWKHIEQLVIEAPRHHAGLTVFGTGSAHQGTIACCSHEEELC